jgi:hypothetical protein
MDTMNRSGLASPASPPLPAYYRDAAVVNILTPSDVTCSSVLILKFVSTCGPSEGQQVFDPIHFRMPIQ